MVSILNPLGYSIPFAAAGTASAIEAATPASTHCVGKLGHEFYGNPVPGTELYPGIQTGMSWKDAKRVAPKLVEGPARVDLFGKRILGTINFEYAGRRSVSSVTFTGRPSDAPAEELTRRFGSPLKVDAGMLSIDSYNSWMPIPG